jgi:hypothetical protein
MKKLLALLVTTASITASEAQFQVNPQLGLTYQNLTSPGQNLSYRGAAGWQFGTDLRIGDRLFFQPGAFLGRNATVVSFDDGNTATIEDGIIRTNLKLRALAGYRIIDGYQFDLRFFMGPSYDVLLSTDSRDERINWNEGDFNKGSFNVDAGLGFDMGYFTLSPSVSFGLSRVFDQDVIAVSDLDSKYLTYGLTLGVNFGDDDK